MLATMDNTTEKVGESPPPKMSTLGNKATGKVFEALPQFEIPPHIRDQLLPLKNASIAEAIGFQFPNILQANTGLAVEEFIRAREPTPAAMLPTTILAIQIPPKAFVEKLADELAREVEEGGVISIACPHAARASQNLFPLWIVTYWLELHEMMHDVVLPWRKATGLLSQRRGLAELKGARTFVSAADEAIEALSKVPWEGKLKGIKQNTSTTMSLHRYLTDKWLSDDNIDQMMRAVQRKVELDGQSQVEIAGIPFVHYLMKGYRTCGAGDSPKGKHQYQTAREWKSLRNAGEEFATGAKHEFATVINVNDNHWVAVVLDFQTLEIHYGDSLGYMPDSNIMAAFDWWTTMHTGRQFTFRNLNITRQADFVSCGLLSVNALANYFLPEHFPMIGKDEVAEGRLKMLKLVVDEHIDEVHYHHCTMFVALTISQTFRFGRATTVESPFDFSFDLRPGPVAPETPKRTRDIPLNDVTASVSKLNLENGRTDLEDASSGDDYDPTAAGDFSSESEDDRVPHSPSPITQSNAQASSTGSSSSSQSLLLRGSPVSAEDSASKRTYQNLSSTPPPSPKKKKQKADARTVSENSEDSPRGILRFYKKCTKEEYDAQTKREAERTMANWEAHKALEARENERKREEEREGAKMRKRKQRALEREKEVDAGIRSPGGTLKRKVEPFLYLSK